MRAIKSTVIIEPIEHFKTTSGIFIGAKELENPIGIVFSAGAGTKKRPMTVKDGDKVIYRSNVGQKLEYEDKKLLVLQEVHIIGIQ